MSTPQFQQRHQDYVIGPNQDTRLASVAAGQSAIANPPLTTWGVLLEWTGNKSQVLPLVEFIVKRVSDGSGCFLSISLCDAQWFDLKRRDARRIFDNLVKLSKRVRFSPYVRVSLSNNKRVVQHSVRGRCPKIEIRGAA